jgi:tRNA pseudouridine55 synthase
MPDGILIIDKPAGWTSMDVCAKVRGILHERRVGHAGTLDPMATGVLPVFVGRATRAVEFAEGGRKEYLAGLRLGLVTDTQDVTGETLETRPVSVTPEQLAAALARFTGEILQTPPMYSAVKVNGQRLYALARKGAEVERRARPVSVYALELLEARSETDFLVRCVCSKGTYVRTLCHDVGAALGCGGCLFSLRRTEAAGFSLARAVTLEQLQSRGAELLEPLDAYFAPYPAYTVPTAGREVRVRNGAPITDESLADGTYRVYGADGAFLCLSRARGGVLTAVKNFF